MYQLFKIKKIYIRLITIMVAIGLLFPPGIFAEELVNPIYEPLEKPTLVSFEECEEQQQRLDDTLETYEEIKIKEEIEQDKDYSEDGKNNSGYGIVEPNGESVEKTPAPPSEQQSSENNESNQDANSAGQADETSPTNNDVDTVNLNFNDPSAIQKALSEIHKIQEDQIESLWDGIKNEIINIEGNGSQINAKIAEIVSSDVFLDNDESLQSIEALVNALVAEYNAEYIKNSFDELRQKLDELKKIGEILYNKENINIDDARTLLRFYKDSDGEDGNIVELPCDENGNLIVADNNKEKLRCLMSESDQMLTTYGENIAELENLEEASKEFLISSINMEDGKTIEELKKTYEDLMQMKERKEEIEEAVDEYGQQLNKNIGLIESNLSNDVTKVVEHVSSASVDTSKYSIGQNEYSIVNPASVLRTGSELPKRVDGLSEEPVEEAGPSMTYHDNNGDEVAPQFYVRDIEITPKENNVTEPSKETGITTIDPKTKSAGTLTIEYIEDRKENIAETEITNNGYTVLLVTDPNNMQHQPILSLVPAGHNNGGHKDITGAVDAGSLDSVIDKIYDVFDDIASGASDSRADVNSRQTKSIKLDKTKLYSDNADVFGNFNSLISKLFVALDDIESDNLTKNDNRIHNPQSNKKPYNFNDMLRKWRIYDDTEKNSARTQEEIIESMRQNIQGLLAKRDLAIQEFYESMAPYYNELLPVLSKAYWLWEKQGIDPNLYLSGADGVVNSEEMKQAVARAVRYLSENIPDDPELRADRKEIIELCRILSERYIEPASALFRQRMSEAWREFYEALEKDMSELVFSDAQNLFTELFDLLNKNAYALVQDISSSILDEDVEIPSSQSQNSNAKTKFSSRPKISRDRIKDNRSNGEVIRVIREELYNLVSRHNDALSEFYVDTSPYYKELMSILKKSQWLKETYGIDSNWFKEAENGFRKFNNEIRLEIEKLMDYVYKNQDNEEAKKIIEFEKKLRAKYVEPALASFGQKVKEASREFYESVEENAKVLTGPFISIVDGKLEAIIVLPIVFPW